jgi:ribonuclease Z
LRPSITAFSTALFSTWIFVEEFRLLFDAGDGVMSSLLHKARKIRHVAMSHADRDHVMGLMQLNHHNARHTLEAVYYPADSGSFPEMRDFVAGFDRETAGCYPWVGVRPGESYPIANDLALRVVSNSHMPGEQVKSVGYIVERTFRKLKPELEALTKAEVGRLGQELGSDAITEPRSEPLLGYSGDTGVCPPAHWAGCKTLIHEATFLSREDIEEEDLRHAHSYLEEVLAMAAEVRPEHLVLTHFSSRYKPGGIEEAIRLHALNLGLACNVFAVMPGEVCRDLLSRPPVWAAPKDDTG